MFPVLLTLRQPTAQLGGTLPQNLGHVSPFCFIVLSQRAGELVCVWKASGAGRTVQGIPRLHHAYTTPRPRLYQCLTSYQVQRSGNGPSRIWWCVLKHNLELLWAKKWSVKRSRAKKCCRRSSYPTKRKRWTQRAAGQTT